METIIIKEMSDKATTKGNALSLVINGNRNTSIPAWLTQEISFIKNDVGVGGSFKADIVQNGNYTNIENIDMNSAVKNDLGAPVEKVVDTPVVKGSPNPQRVGLFIKLAVEMLVAAPQEGKNVEENLCENIQEIKKLEDFTIKLLG